MNLLYNIAIYLYLTAINVASLFNKKAKLWRNGRKKQFELLRSKIKPEDRIFWFHASSLGEFEQGRPVMEKVKKEFPQIKILLTFFSPSGYEIRKNYEVADYVFYMPIDTKKNAVKFIDVVKPEMAFFIKYEFWFNYIDCLFKKNIPVYFFSVIFRKDQHFFKWYGSWFRQNLKKINWFFVQNIDSIDLLKRIQVDNVSLCGDTRFDRVFEVTQNKKSFPLIEKFCGGNKIVLAGSSWPADEEILAEYIKTSDPDVKFIIAPHEIHKEHLESIIQKLKVPFIKYSKISNENIPDKKVLIVDCIGILLHLYQYASFAYIGGGFGKSIHNILEAATFGKPVIFGPNFNKFQEAKDLVRLGGAFKIQNYDDFKIISDKLLSNKNYLNERSFVCANYVKENTGATKIIFNKIFDSFNVHI
jgi:3-deoxy-D-manno-octulosonic-acid transferase